MFSVSRMHAITAVPATVGESREEKWPSVSPRLYWHCFGVRWISYRHGSLLVLSLHNIMIAQFWAPAVRLWRLGARSTHYCFCRVDRIGQYCTECRCVYYHTSTCMY